LVHSPRKTKSPAINMKEIYNWEDVAIKKKVNGWNIITIPKGTILYRGILQLTPKEFNRTEGRHKKSPYRKDQVVGWYGSFPIASWYAFNAKQTGWSSNKGKIIAYETTKNINLLDIDEVNNYKRLNKKELPEIYGESILKHSFGYDKNTTTNKELSRQSEFIADNKFAVWLCKHIPNIDGLASIDIPHHHSEIMLCNPKILKNTLYEYRWVAYYKPKYIIQTYNGRLTGVEIPIDSIYFMIRNHKFSLKNVYIKSYLYEPQKNSKWDKFYFNTDIQHVRKKIQETVKKEGPMWGYNSGIIQYKID